MISTRPVIKNVLSSDIQSIVKIHFKSFEGFFLSFMGKQFLKVLYQSICEDSSGIGYYCEVDGNYAGFVFGTTHLSGFYSKLLKRKLLKFFLASIHPIIKKPSIIPRLVRVFSLPNREKTNGNCATLMSIAVDPEFQGKGVGKLLVNQFLIEASRRGKNCVKLKTDAKDNDATNEFYQSLGFILYHTFTTPEGREMNEYRILLDSDF